MKQENQVLINYSEMTVNHTAMHCNTLHYTVEYNVSFKFTTFHFTKCYI